MKRTLLISLLIIVCNFANAQTIENLDVDKLKNLEKQIRVRDSITNIKIKNLENSINNKNFLNVLKEANAEKFKSDVNSLKDRYIAGESILLHIIKETNSFNLQYQQLVLQDEFTSLTNPTNYTDFTTPLTNTLNSLKDKKPIPDIAQSANNLSQNIPFLNNPAVSSGLSIASYFIAKYNDKKKFENESFKQMMCVINFTSSANSEYKLNAQRIIFLKDRIEKYNKNVKIFFSQYLEAVNYKNGYDNYSQQIINSGSNFMEPIRNSFFDSLLNETTNVGIVSLKTDKDDNVSYYIEQLKFQIAEYELIINEIGNSIEMYEIMNANLNQLASSSCPNILSTAQPKLNNITSKITSVKKAYEVVYNENRIPGYLKSKLFGL